MNCPPLVWMARRVPHLHRRTRRVGSLRCRGQFSARSPKSTSPLAALIPRPSTLARCGSILPGDDRRGHGQRRTPHRRPPHLARSCVFRRQGAAPISSSRAGRASRGRRALRLCVIDCPVRNGGRRRPRNRHVAPHGDAGHADDAGFSANLLAALILPASLRRLYIAIDSDAAGRHAANV